MEANWNDWIGRRETRTDRVTATPIAALAATLDRDDAPPADGEALPPLWHWLYFLPLYRQSDVGPDGHARRGGYLLRRQRPEARLAAFTFRAVSALFDSAPFSVRGRAVDETSVRLWAANAAGGLAMDATATLA